MEHPCNATRLAHVTASFAENITDLGNGPVPVVGHDLDNDRHAARSVSLVDYFLVRDPRQFAGAFLDRTLDVLGRKADRLRLCDRCPEAGIPAGISASKLGCDRNLLADLGKALSTLRISSGFLVLRCCPF